jgi:hypothetical protein
MIFSPVITDEQHRFPFQPTRPDVGSAEETAAI